MSRRYVVCFEPALANLDAMGNRMATRLESQLFDFLTAWRPEDAFEKQLQSHLWQFKWSPKRGSGARAFAGHFDGERHDIALVFVAFKKTNERRFNAEQLLFNSRSESYVEETLNNKTAAEVDDWIDEQRENSARSVHSKSGDRV